jgi:hypothetical protein
MKLRSLVAVAALVFAGNAAAAESINWQRYVVAESGAGVDIPTSIFTEEAGKPEGAHDRCNFAASSINCVLINYPAAEKRDWDGIVTRISNTLARG